MAGLNTAFPAEFQQSIGAQLGSEADDLFIALQDTPSVSFRLNPGKPAVLPDPAGQVPWCTTGYYLNERPSFTLDPAFHGGAYYVQEASSMLVEAMLEALPDQQAPLRVLDLCAAPGGKTTHLLSWFGETHLIVANEIHPQRCRILRENLTRWGATNTIVTQADPQRMAPNLPGLFDLILVDAPCSGEGMFRKDPGAIREWQPQLVDRCVDRQRSILDAAERMLRPGGHLIYSTCTFNTRENEEQVEWLQCTKSLQPVPVAFPSDWRIQGTTRGNRCWPHLVRGEGFFCALLQKPDESGYVRAPSARAGRTRQMPRWETPKHPILEQFVEDAAFWQFQITTKGEVRGFPAHLQQLASPLWGHRFVVDFGTRIGQIKSPSLFIPDHALALSCQLARERVRRIPVTLDQARQFLRKEALQGLAGDPGIALLSYQDLPLGWIKIVPNRINNLLPHHWRIRRG